MMCLHWVAWKMTRLSKILYGKYMLIIRMFLSKMPEFTVSCQMAMIEHSLSSKFLNTVNYQASRDIFFNFWKVQLEINISTALATLERFTNWAPSRELTKLWNEPLFMTSTGVDPRFAIGEGGEPCWKGTDVWRGHFWQKLMRKQRNWILFRRRCVLGVPPESANALHNFQMISNSDHGYWVMNRLVSYPLLL